MGTEASEQQYLCTSPCNLSINWNSSAHQCVTACLSDFKFINGSSCSSSCDFAFQVSGSNLTCVSSCSWPSALHINSVIDNSTKECSSGCPSGTFLNRTEQNCVSSCEYLNTTLINGNQVCETPGNLTNCPFLKQAQTTDAFLTCVDNCSTTFLYYNNSFN